MKQNKRHSKRFNTFLIEHKAFKHLEKRLAKLLDQINTSEKVVKLKVIADGVLFGGVIEDGKAVVTVDGKEKRLKVNESGKGQFIRINNKAVYL